MHFDSRLLGSAAVACLLAGCTTARGPAEGPDFVAASGWDETADEPFVMLTPATRLSNGHAGIYVPSGTYTRLKVSSRNASNSGSADTGREILPYNARSAFERFFIGKHHSISLTAKVSTGPFRATVPLLTIAHDSTRSEGEAFNRTIRHEAQDFPLFLVRGNSSSDVASVTLDLKGSDTIDSTGAGTALSAVIAATNVVAPTAPLLTTLNSDKSKELATAIDGAINKLFAKAIAEQHVLDRPVRLWTPIVVDLHLPRKEGRWSGLRGSSGTGPGGLPRVEDLDYVRVGTWTLAFDTPRISAFSPVVVLCPGGTSSDAGCAGQIAAARAAATTDVRQHFGDVLNFPVVRDGTTGTLGSYLRQLDWWTASIAALERDASDAGAVCRSIRGAVTEIGFNDIDAFLTVEAVAQSKFVTAGASAAMAAADNCHL